jgi:hypothetical protein
VLRDQTNCTLLDDGIDLLGHNSTSFHPQKDAAENPGRFR